MPGVVSEGTCRPGALLVDLRLPLHVGRWVELADLIFWMGILTKTTHRPVHYVAGNSLNAINEIRVCLAVEWAVIDLPAADVRIINALFDKWHVRGIIDQSAPDELVGIRRAAVS